MKRNFGVLVPVTVAFSVFASVLLAVASQASNSWTLLRPGSPLGAYTSITSSIDGTRLATTIAGGNLIISSDSGKTWTSAATSQLWTGIVSSSDGNYLAAINRGNTVWTSSDAGITWQSHIPKSPKRLFSNPESVAISPNGEHLAITSGIGIWTSDDFGENWVVTKISDITFASNIVYAADGRHLIVLGDTHIFTSADSGSSWVVSSGPKLRGRIATSFDGSHLILVSSGNSAQNQAGDIWTSSDDGVSWMPHANHQYWLDVTSSPDGTKLTAIDQVSSTGSSSYTPGDTGIWTSSDSGLTWVNAGTTGIVSPGSRIVSSNDGARLFVSGWGGGIWTGTNASSVNDSAPTKISGNPLSSPSPTETRSVAGSSSCPNYLFVGMRGSGENYSPGSPAGELGSTLASLWSDLSVTTRFQNLKFSGVASYKAEGIALTKEYFDQVVLESGDQLLTFLLAAQKKCAKTNYILAGYSQGAYAVRAALGQIESRGSQYSILTSKISAAVLLGDPGKSNSGILYFGKTFLKNEYLSLYLKFISYYKFDIAKYSAGNSVPWVAQIKTLLNSDVALSSIQPELEKLQIPKLDSTVPVKIFDSTLDPVANASIVLPNIESRLSAIFQYIETYANPVNFAFTIFRFNHITLNQIFDQFSELAFNWTTLSNGHTKYASSNFGRSVTDWIVTNAR